jgi:quercetin dioxygenase-like cupin family protein
MPKKSLIEELDRAIDRMIGDPGACLPDVDSRIAPLIRIAADLRDLATDKFQGRLKRELLASLAPASHAGTVSPDRSDAPLGLTVDTVDTDDPNRGRRDQGTGYDLQPRDIAAALENLEKAGSDSPASSLGLLATLDQHEVGVARYSDQTPLWSRNPDADELLHVLEGELDVTSLTEDGLVHTSVPAGSIFVCHRGLWHWHRPLPTASLLFVGPENGTEYSHAELPRLDPGQGLRGARRRSATQKRDGGAESAGVAPQMAARNVRAALSGIPVLAISEKTTGEEAAAAFPQLGSLDGCGLYAGRFSGLSPWERHTSADELLHVLEGELEITTLTDQGPVRNTLRAGTVFVCPRGLWHRQYSKHGVLEFSATPQPTEVSFAEDPRA